MVNRPQRRLLHPRSYAHEKGQFEDGSEHDLLIGQPLDLVKDGLPFFSIELAVLPGIGRTSASWSANR
jgi:hypothetical protein